MSKIVRVSPLELIQGERQEGGCLQIQRPTPEECAGYIALAIVFLFGLVLGLLRR